MADLTLLRRNVLVKEVLGALGLAPARPLRSLALPAAHVAVLYAGPLLHEATRQDPVVERIDGYRAHVMALQRLRSLVVSPFVEEFVFRACMLPLLLRGGWSPGSAALLAPVIFGVAHLHHLHDLVVHQGREVGDAVAAVAFQFGYTSLFGAYASLLFLRTRSLGELHVYGYLASLSRSPGGPFRLSRHPLRLPTQAHRSWRTCSATGWASLASMTWRKASAQFSFSSPP